MYLFASDEQKKAFGTDPKAYVDVDLALGGKCPVCLVDSQKEVPGKAELTVHHGGLRYLFPTAAQKEKFLADPGKYATSAAAVTEPAAQPPGSSSR